jgi:tetratricopeptide (TPR) repeat protein
MKWGSDVETTETATYRTYCELRDAGIEATQRGRLHEARESFDAAHRLAASLGATIEDRAYCNVAAVDIELGCPLDTLIPRLRSIFTLSKDAENARTAAYHLARIYNVRREVKKGLFYARISRQRSQQMERPDWVASSLNQVGNLLVVDSRFEAAAVEFEAALELMPVEDSVPRALVLDNLGYCRLVQGRMSDGFGYAFEALRILRRLDARWWFGVVHLTLCFGYIESERLRPASRHGLRALRLSAENADDDVRKKALFLMGEVTNLSGDCDVARDYFCELQERYYPDHTFLPEFLLAVDVRHVVNLKG